MKQFEDRIQKKAEKRFEELMIETYRYIRSNKILNSLKIFKDKNKNKKDYLSIVSEMGSCPGRDLLNTSDASVLKEHTNFEELKEALIEKFKEQELSSFLEKLETLRDILE
jgi:hypothetical protein